MFVGLVNKLVIARSRSRSSELGALNQSLRLTFSYSRPMAGVISKDLNWSRIPFSFIGSLIKEDPFDAPWEVAMADIITGK